MSAWRSIEKDGRRKARRREGNNRKTDKHNNEGKTGNRPGCTLGGNFQFSKDRKSVIWGVWAAPGARETIPLGGGIVACLRYGLSQNLAVLWEVIFNFLRIGNRSFGGSGRPRGPGRPFRWDRGLLEVWIEPKWLRSSFDLEGKDPVRTWM